MAHQKTTLIDIEQWCDFEKTNIHLIFN